MSKIFRNLKGQFQSDHERKQLLEIGRAVVKVALSSPSSSKARPYPGRALVSQSSYDRARAEAGYPDSPAARSLCQRLGYSWPDLCRVLTATGQNANEISLGHHDPFGSKYRRVFDADECRDALRVIIAHLGRAPQPKDYDDARQQLLRSSKRAWKAGALTPAALPTSNQIVRRLGGKWADILASIGETFATRAVGISPPLVAEAILDVTGKLPTRKAVVCVAKDLGFALARTTGPDYNAAIAQMRLRRAAVGRDTPGKATTAEPLIKELSDEEREGVRQKLRSQTATGELPSRQHFSWSEEECLEKLREFLAELPPSEPAIKAVYGPMSRRRPDWPSIATLGRLGVFDDLIAKAREAGDQSPATDQGGHAGSP